MIVMKFGGSSVKDAVSIERVIKIIQERLPLQPVVVVSAMGNTTRNLLAAGAAAAQAKTDDALSQLAAIEAYHRAELSQLVKDHTDRPVFSLIARYFTEMQELVKGLSRVARTSQ